MTAWLASAIVTARPTWCTLTARYGNTRCVAATCSSSLVCLQAPGHATSQTDAVSVIRSGPASKSAMGKASSNRHERDVLVKHAGVELLTALESGGQALNVLF